MRELSLAAAGAGITLLATVARFGSTLAVGLDSIQRLAHLIPGGTAGEVSSVVITVTGTVHPLVAVVLGGALGYYALGRRSSDGSPRDLAAPVAAGSALVAIVAVAVAVVGLPLLSGESIGAFEATLFVAGSLRTLVDTTLVVVVGAVAGAALAGGDPVDGTPPRGSTVAPTADDSGLDDSGPDESTSGESSTSVGERSSSPR